MTVKDRMSSPAVTATPATKTKDALQTMYVRKIRRMPVVDDQGKLLRIFTQRDLFEKGKADTPVGTIMTRDPYTTAIDASIVHAATLMRNLGVGALPVLDRGHPLVSDLFGIAEVQVPDCWRRFQQEQAFVVINDEHPLRLNRGLHGRIQ